MDSIIEGFGVFSTEDVCFQQPHSPIHTAIYQYRSQYGVPFCMLIGFSVRSQTAITTQKTKQPTQQPHSMHQAVSTFS